ncbi:diacylglycerol kinase epsilon-like [Limulus polyphemus]|uniref:Diacylglycerol kinase n=1 Tax=Limulus polyphemus TaxID=6850 RepID=A0ABM1T0H9_LIMPO|nr:diacylglycerol kinase epsilon-like [Limulus polyphemus]
MYSKGRLTEESFSVKMWLLTNEEMATTYQVSLFAGAFMVLALVVWRISRRQRHYEVPARDIRKGHRWCQVDILSHTAYCNVCEGLIVDGWYCDSCGVCADHGCFRKADKGISCKFLSRAGNSSIKHHWVKGNLPLGSICDVCEGECGFQALTDFRCCWCQRTVHTCCQPMMAEICDFGRFKSFIVPPYCVRLKLVGLKGRRHLVVSEVRLPNFRPWCPLIVIANAKSGNNEGDLILRAFRGILNTAQVIDLHDLPPESGLEWCNLVPDQTCRVLVAGGDGTVGWVLNAIQKLKLFPQPQVCILPLGTGNDLSRVLGWGDGYSGNIDVKNILDQIASSTCVKLDRWKVKLSSERHLGIPIPSREILMNNYASVGVDALVTLNFHKTRESKFYLYSSRLLNKFLYLSYGTKDILERECKNLHQKLELQLDGKPVNLPELEAIVILNIPSWGAGVRPWQMGSRASELQPLRFDDGILEVIGIYSSFHIAQLQVGLSEPLRLGRAKEIKLSLHEKVPMQVDGEPWEQHPADITVTYNGQVTMLSNFKN